MKYVRRFLLLMQSYISITVNNIGLLSQSDACPLLYIFIQFFSQLKDEWRNTCAAKCVNNRTVLVYCILVHLI